MTKERIEWIDIAKGITILLVIVGHGSINSVLRGIIFSFHMPLFFILSSITFRLSENCDMFVRKTEKAFVHLMLAAIGIYFFRTLLHMAQNYSALHLSDLHALKDYLAERINILVYSSGVATPVGNTWIPAIGVPWFLIALFFGRTLFDYLHLKLKKTVLIIVICLASIIGLCFGIIQWLPFSIDIALAIQPFFALGVWMKKLPLEKNTGKFCIGSLGIWAGTFIIIGLISHTYLELAVRRYPLFPLCFLCAAAGTMFFSSFSYLLCSKRLFASPLKYLGKYSMVMLWIHCFDSLYSFAYNITDNGYINISLRVLADIAVFAIVMFIRYFFKKHVRIRNNYKCTG